MISLAWRSAFGAFYALAICVLYLPIMTVAVYAFFPRVRGKVDFSAPTLQYFKDLLDNESVIDAVRNSATVAVAATLAALVFGLFYALLLNGRSPGMRRIFEALIYAPFIVPPIIVGLSLLLASAATGVPRGLATIIIGHALFTLAISYRLISVRLAALPLSHVEAARDLGATPWQTFRLVIFPHLRTALLASGMLAILLSFDETLITALVSGNTTTLPLRLWSMMRIGFSPEINALVVVFVATLLVVALLTFSVFGRSRADR